ncbi:MAG: hypothetical protein QW657_06500, partial [Candidatus Bathyarchaeia archaeon]
LGAILGASIFSLLNRVTSILNFIFLDLPIDPNYIRWMITGVLIVIVLIYKPKGILAEKPVKTDAWRMFGEVQRDWDRIISVIQRASEYFKRALYWLIGGK